MNDFNFHKEITETVRNIINLETSHINYILVKKQNNKEFHCIASVDKTNPKVTYNISFDQNKKININDFLDRNDIDSSIFNYLEKGYKIYYMDSCFHYGIWININESYNNITHKAGLQLYLQYCKQNHIDKNFMRLFHTEIDVMQFYQEQVNNYKIIASTTIGSTSVVLAYNEKAPSPYVTWDTTPDRRYGYSSGHYFPTLKAAFNDYKKRAKTNFDSHIRYEKNRLEIKENKTKGLNR